MKTELFITTPRAGTCSITSGSFTLDGTGTNFTASDVGKQIIIRTSSGDLRRVIDAVTDAVTVNLDMQSTVTQSGCYFYIDYASVDLADDIPFPLTYKIADVREPDKRDSSRSLTLKIPGTKANNIIFDHIYEIDLEGSFNPNIRAFIIVYEDYIPIFIGNLQLLKINRDRDKIEYECAAFGKVGDVFQKIGDKLLTDLDLSDLDEYGTNAQIQSSWSGSDLIYPLINNGRNNFQQAIPAFFSPQISPALKASIILERILSSVGYTIADSATLYSETRLQKLFIPCLKDWRRKVFIDFGLRGNYTTGGTGNTGDIELVIERIRSGTTETIATGQTVTDSASSVAYQTTIFLDYGDVVYFNIVPDVANVADSFTEVDHADTYLNITYLDNEFTYNTNGNNQLDLSGNVVLAGAGTSTKKVTYNNEISDVNNTWSTNKHTVPVKHTQGFLPDNYKQRDFLLALIKIFNLYLDPVFDNDSQINILPRDTYYSQGSVVDWTQKIDVGQNIELIPMGELDWKEYLFSWKEDADFYNSDYKGKVNEVYGQRTVLVESDFITTKKKIELEVSPMPLAGDSHHVMILPSCIREGAPISNNQFAGNLRLIFFNGTTMPQSFTLDGGAITDYPFSGHLVGTPQVPTFDFNWASPRYLYYTMNDPSLYPVSANIYTSYWQNFIEEISDKYSKLMTAYFNLTAEDIRTLDFRNSFFINGSYYRLNKVIDYNPVKSQLTKCEFLRIQDSVYVASNTIVSHGDTEVVTTAGNSLPLVSSELSTGTVVVGDSLGVAGTSEALSNVGDLFVWDGSGLKRLPAPATGEVLTGDTTDPLGIKWDTSSGGGESLASTLAIGNTTGGHNLEVSAADKLIVDDATASKPLASGSSKEVITSTDSIEGSFINSLTAKTTPVDADYAGLMDSADSNKLKKLSWANIKATLKTYFDSLYALVGSVGSSGLTMATAKILGRNTAGTGAIEELTAIPNGITATTQSASDNSTKLATTAYVDAQVVVQTFELVRGYQALGSVIKAIPLGMGIDRVTTNAGLTSTELRFTPVYIPYAQTITGVKWWQVTAGVYTASNYNGVGLYSYSGGTLTLVASSTDDGAIWKAASGTLGSKAFSSTYNAAAGLYFIATLHSRSATTTAPTIGCNALFAGNVATTIDFTNSAKLAGYVSSQTSLPATQAASGITASTNIYYWAALY